MSSTVPNFFSRDAMLKRHARTSRIRNVDISKPLHIIVEEDEHSRASSSRSPSPAPSHMTTNAGLAVKARRRHANLSISDIRIARDNIIHDDSDVFRQNDLLLSAPRPAPRPPTAPSPVPSPDSFRLTFTDVSYKFPHPPIPTPSSLRSYTSCSSPTPSMSSSDSSPCSQFGNLPPTPSTSDDEFALPSPRFNPRRAAIKPLVIAKHGSPSTSPFSDCPISASLLQPFKNSLERPIPFSPLSPSSEESCSESDDESDSEWYTREFSKILTLSSPLPATQKPSRPESIFVPRPSPTSSQRFSKPLPLTPTTPSPVSPFFSAAKRASRRRSVIPNYPPPPVPTLLRSSSTSSSITSSSDLHHLNSPFPVSPTSAHSRMTQTPSSLRPPPRSSIPADCVFDADDQSSVFSLSLYEDDLASACSHSSESDDFRFDMDMAEDYPMMLPVSVPTSPVDPETDIADGLEDKAHPSTDTAFDLSSPSPSPMLKSKWSSSTIGSIREEHEHRGPSAKLRLYFGGGGKRNTGSAKKTSSMAVPQTPTSPGMKSPRHGRYSSRRESDVMIIGYGHGVRRRGSVTPTISDAGSDDSGMSTTSSGLRRKPIPVEMFLRSAV